MSEKEQKRRVAYRKNREKWIFLQTVIIVVLTVALLVSSIVAIQLKSKYYVNYTEGGSIDYNVFLKENEFYQEEYIGKDQSYVASLIDRIIADYSYTIEENHYTFAINYLDVDLGNVDVGRRAFFEIIENSDGSITAHIYEYITASALEIASIADVYITEDYVTVVGNKASGMAVFEGTICELYSVATGKMIAYEVKESLSGITYNTLWFDLEDIDGITSIKAIPNESAELNENKNIIYLNGATKEWSVKNYGFSGGVKVLSRRFDIELRTQIFYYYDTVTGETKKVERQVPMLFVQEEVYDDLVEDVKDENKITLSVKISEANLTKLTDEYAKKTDLLEENKDKYSVEQILNYIGDKKTFA